MTFAEQPIFEGGGEHGDRQHDARLAGHLERNPEILSMERQAEAERVLVIDHPRAPIGQDPALGCTARKRLHQQMRIQTRPNAEDDSFCDAEISATDDHLVHGLGGLAVSERSHVSDRPPDSLEDRTGARYVGVGTADEYRQGTEASSLGAARDRGVDHTDAAFGQALAQAARRLRRDGRTIDDERSRGDALRHSGGAEEDGRDIGAVRDAHDDNV